MPNHTKNPPSDARRQGVGLVGIKHLLLAALMLTILTSTHAADILLGNYSISSTEMAYWKKQASRINPNDEPAKINKKAKQLACQVAAIHAEADDHHIQLTTRQKTTLQKRRLDGIKTYGSATEYINMASKLYGSEALYYKLGETDFLTQNVFNHFYTPLSEKTNSSIVQQYIDNHHLINVAYLRFPYDNTKKHQQQQLALEIQATLTNTSNKLSKINALGLKHPKSSSALGYLNGHLLKENYFGSKITKSTIQLKTGQLSGLLDSGKEFLLLLKLPINADSKYNKSNRTLRYWSTYHVLFKPRISQRCKRLSNGITPSKTSNKNNTKEQQ